ncbi:MAG: GIY-YIG nuclease family protein [Hyphomicrobiaceae bacterium]
MGNVATIKSRSGYNESMDRDFILKEIRRVAELDGSTPGSQRFERATGIRKHDWFGVYWARWGDALTAAGLEPNAFNSAMDAEDVVAAYIALVEELGRIPTQGDIRLRRRGDPSFPSHSTFSKRLGSKSERLGKALEHARVNNAKETTIQLIEEAIEEAAERIESSTSASSPEEEAATGYVYLMKSGRYFKIGKTNSLDRRQYEIGLQLPEGITPIHSIETDDPSGIEAYWHNRFRDKRKNGEWFDLGPSDVKAFRRRKFM